MSYAKLEIDILSARDIGISAKMAYSAIISHYRNETSEMFPSYATIGKLMGKSRRQAIRAVNELLQAGYITKESRINVDHNGLASNKYNLVSKMTLPSVKNDTTSSVKNDTTPSVKNDTLNKESLKRENLNNLKKATGDVRHSPELTGEQQPAKDITSKMQKLLGKGFEWVEAIENNGKLYLRYSSPVSKKYFDNKRIEETTSFFLTEIGQAPEPVILEHNQARETGVIL